MPRTPQQNQVIKDKRRGKIIAAAVRVFATKDYDSVAIDDITAVVDCSHGLFYHYFQAKEDVIRAVLQEVVIPNGVIPPVEKAAEIGGANGLRILCDYMADTLSAGTKVFNLAMIWLRLIKATKLPKDIEDVSKSHLILPTLEKLVHEGQVDGDVINGSEQEIAGIIHDLYYVKMIDRKDNGKNNKYFTSDVLYGMLLKHPIQ
ncbi:MAG: TetR/AcrR family transcriptional regulator [Bacilli bacterium]|nr:TetR/AcrR family transcriptional regulator [Bacilli bacterium]